MRSADFEGELGLLLPKTETHLSGPDQHFLL